MDKTASNENEELNNIVEDPNTSVSNMDDDDDEDYSRELSYSDSSYSSDAPIPSKIRKYRNKIEKFQTEIKTRDAAITQLTSSLQASIKERHDLEEQFENIVAEASRLQKQLDAYLRNWQTDEQLSILEETCKRQEKDLQTINASMTEVETAMAGMQRVGEERDQLKAKVTNVEQRLAEKSTEMNELRTKYETEANFQKKSYDNMVLKYQEENKHLRQQIEGKDALIKENSQLQRNLDTSAVKTRQLEQENVKLIAKLTTSEETTKENKKLMEDIVWYKDTIKKQEQKIDTMKEEQEKCVLDSQERESGYKKELQEMRSSLSASEKSLAQEAAKHEQQMEVVKRTILTLESRMKDREQEHGAEIDILQRRLQLGEKELLEMVTNLRTDLHNENEEVRRLQAEVDSRREIYEQLQREFDESQKDYQKEIGDLKEMVRGISEQLDASESQSRILGLDLEKSRTMESNFKEQETSWKADEQRLHEQINALHKHLEVLEEEKQLLNTELEKQKDKFERDFAEAKKSNEKEAESLKEQIQFMNEKIENVSKQVVVSEILERELNDRISVQNQELEQFRLVQTKAVIREQEFQELINTLQMQLENRDTEKQQLKTEMETQQEKYKQLQCERSSSKEACEKEVNCLKMQIQCISDKLKVSEKTNGELQSCVSEYSRKLEQFKKGESNYKEREVGLQARVQELEELSHSLHTQLEDRDSEKQALQSEYDSFKDHLQCISGQLDFYKQLEKELQDRILELDQELKLFRTTEMICKERETAEQNKFEQLQSEYDSLKGCLQNTSEQLTTLSKQLDASRKMEKELQDRTLGQDQELELFRTAEIGFKERDTIQQNKLEQLQSEYDNLKESETIQKSKLEQLQSEYDDLKERETIQQSKLEQLQSEYDVLKEREAIQQSKLEQLQLEYDDLEERETIQKSKLEELQSEYDDFKQRETIQKSKLEQLQSEYDALSTQLDASTKQGKELKGRILEQDQELESCRKMEISFNDRETILQCKLDQLQSDHDDLKEHLKCTNKELESFSNQLDTSKKSEQELQNHIIEQNRKLELFEKVEVDFKEKELSWQARIGNINKEIKKYEISKESITEKEEQITQLQKTIESANVELEDCRTDKETLEKHCVELKSELEEKAKDNDNQRNMLQNRIDVLNEELERYQQQEVYLNNETERVKHELIGKNQELQNVACQWEEYKATHSVSNDDVKALEEAALEVEKNFEDASLKGDLHERIEQPSNVEDRKSSDQFLSISSKIKSLNAQLQEQETLRKKVLQEALENKNEVIDKYDHMVDILFSLLKASEITKIDEEERGLMMKRFEDPELVRCEVQKLIEEKKEAIDEQERLEEELEEARRIVQEQKNALNDMECLCEQNELLKKQCQKMKEEQLANVTKMAEALKAAKAQCFSQMSDINVQQEELQNMKEIYNRNIEQLNDELEGVFKEKENLLRILEDKELYLSTLSKENKELTCRISAGEIYEQEILSALNEHKTSLSLLKNRLEEQESEQAKAKASVIMEVPSNDVRQIESGNATLFQKLVKLETDRENYLLEIAELKNKMGNEDEVDNDGRDEQSEISGLKARYNILEERNKRLDGNVGLLQRIMSEGERCWKDYMHENEKLKEELQLSQVEKQKALLCFENLQKKQVEARDQTEEIVALREKLSQETLKNAHFVQQLEHLSETCDVLREEKSLLSDVIGKNTISVDEQDGSEAGREERELENIKSVLHKKLQEKEAVDSQLFAERSKQAALRTRMEFLEQMLAEKDKVHEEISQENKLIEHQLHDAEQSLVKMQETMMNEKLQLMAELRQKDLKLEHWDLDISIEKLNQKKKECEWAMEKDAFEHEMKVAAEENHLERLRKSQDRMQQLHNVMLRQLQEHLLVQTRHLKQIPKNEDVIESVITVIKEAFEELPRSATKVVVLPAQSDAIYADVCFKKLVHQLQDMLVNRQKRLLMRAVDRWKTIHFPRIQEIVEKLERSMCEVHDKEEEDNDDDNEDDDTQSKRKFLQEATLWYDTVKQLAENMSELRRGMQAEFQSSWRLRTMAEQDLDSLEQPQPDSLDVSSHKPPPPFSTFSEDYNITPTRQSDDELEDSLGGKRRKKMDQDSLEKLEEDTDMDSDSLGAKGLHAQESPGKTLTDRSSNATLSLFSRKRSSDTADSLDLSLTLTPHTTDSVEEQNKALTKEINKLKRYIESVGPQMQRLKNWNEELQNEANSMKKLDDTVSDASQISQEMDDLSRKNEELSKLRTENEELRTKILALQQHQLEIASKHSKMKEVDIQTDDDGEVEKLKDRIKELEEANKKLISDTDELRKYFEERCSKMEQSYSEDILQNMRDSVASGGSPDIENLSEEINDPHSFMEDPFSVHLDVRDPEEKYKLEYDQKLLQYRDQMEEVKQEMIRQHKQELEDLEKVNEQETENLKKMMESEHASEMSLLQSGHNQELVRLRETMNEARGEEIAKAQLECTKAMQIEMESEIKQIQEELEVKHVKETKNIKLKLEEATKLLDEVNQQLEKAKKTEESLKTDLQANEDRIETLQRSLDELKLDQIESNSVMEGLRRDIKEKEECIQELKEKLAEKDLQIEKSGLAEKADADDAKEIERLKELLQEKEKQVEEMKVKLRECSDRERQMMKEEFEDITRIMQREMEEEKMSLIEESSNKLSSIQEDHANELQGLQQAYRAEMMNIQSSMEDQLRYHMNQAEEMSQRLNDIESQATEMQQQALFSPLKNANKDVQELVQDVQNRYAQKETDIIRKYEDVVQQLKHELRLKDESLELLTNELHETQEREERNRTNNYREAARNSINAVIFAAQHGEYESMEEGRENLSAVMDEHIKELESKHAMEKKLLTDSHEREMKRMRGEVARREAEEQVLYEKEMEGLQAQVEVNFANRHSEQQKLENEVKGLKQQLEQLQKTKEDHEQSDEQGHVSSLKAENLTLKNSTNLLSKANQSLLELVSDLAKFYSVCQHTNVLPSPPEHRLSPEGSAMDNDQQQFTPKTTPRNEQNEWMLDFGHLENLLLNPEIEVNLESKLSQEIGLLRNKIQGSTSQILRSFCDDEEMQDNKTQEESMLQSVVKEVEVDYIKQRVAQLGTDLQKECAAREDLTVELHKARSQIRGYEKERESLLHQIHVLEETKEGLLREVQSLRDQVSEEPSQEEVLHSEDHETNVVLSLQARAKELMDDGELTSLDRDELLHRLKELELTIEELSNRNQQLTENKQKIVDDLSRQMEAADKQLQAKKQFLDEQAVEREQEREEFNRTVTSLQDQLRQREKESRADDMLKKEVDSLDQQLKDLTETNRVLVATNEDLEKGLKNNKDKIMDLRDVIRTLEAQLEDKAVGENKALEELHTYKTALFQQSKLQDELTDELQTLQQGTISKQLSHQIQLLEDQLNKKSQQLEGYQQMQEAMKDIRAQILSMESKVDMKTRELEALQLSISTASTPNTEDISIRHNDTLDTPRLIGSSEDLSSTQSPIPALNVDELKRLEDKLDHLTRAEEAAIKRSRDLEMQLKKCRKLYEEAVVEREALMGQNNTQLIQISSLKSRLEEHKHQNDAGQIERLKDQLSTAQAECDLAKEENELLKREVNDLKYDIEQVKQKLAEREDELEEMKDADSMVALMNELTNTKTEMDRVREAGKQKDVHLEEIRQENTYMKEMIENNGDVFPLSPLAEELLEQKDKEIEELEKKLKEMTSQLVYQTFGENVQDSHEGTYLSGELLRVPEHLRDASFVSHISESTGSHEQSSMKLPTEPSLGPAEQGFNKICRDTVITELEEKTSQLQKMTEERELELKAEKEESRKLNDQLQELTASQMTLRKECEELSLEVDNKKREASIMKEQLDSVLATRPQLEARADQLQEELEKLKIHLEETQQLANDRQAKREELEEEVAKAQSKLKEKDDQLAEMEVQINDLTLQKRKALVKLKQTKEKAQQKLEEATNQMKAEIDVKHQQVNRLEHKVAELSPLQKARAQLQQQLQETEQNNQQLRDQMDTLKREQDDKLNIQLKKNQIEKARLQAQLKESESRGRNANEVEDLKKHLEKVQNEKVTSLKAENDLMKVQLDHTEQIVNSMKEDWENKIQQLKAENKRLQSQVEEMNRLKQDKTSDEDKKEPGGDSQQILQLKEEIQSLRKDVTGKLDNISEKQASTTSMDELAGLLQQELEAGTRHDNSVLRQLLLDSSNGSRASPVESLDGSTETVSQEVNKLLNKIHREGSQVLTLSERLFLHQLTRKDSDQLQPLFASQDELVRTQADAETKEKRLQSLLHTEQQRYQSMLQKLEKEQIYSYDLQQKVFVMEREIENYRAQQDRERAENLSMRLQLQNEAERIQKMEKTLKAEKESFQLLKVALESEKRRGRSSHSREHSLMEEMKKKIEDGEEQIHSLRAQLTAARAQPADSSFMQHEYEEEHLRFLDAIIALEKEKETNYRLIQERQQQKDLYAKIAELTDHRDRLALQLEKERENVQILYQEIQQLKIREDKREQQHSTEIETLKDLKRRLEENLAKTQAQRWDAQEKESIAKHQLSAARKAEKQLETQLNMERQEVAHLHNRMMAMERDQLVSSEDLKSSREMDLIEKLEIEIDKNKKLVADLTRAKSGSRYHMEPLRAKAESQKMMDHLLEKYRRCQSHRKSLAWQKKYLLILLGNYKETEASTAGHLAKLNRSTVLYRNALTPKQKFRVLAYMVVAVERFKYIGRRSRAVNKKGRRLLENMLESDNPLTTPNPRLSSMPPLSHSGEGLVSDYLLKESPYSYLPRAASETLSLPLMVSPRQDPDIPQNYCSPPTRDPSSQRDSTRWRTEGPLDDYLDRFDSIQQTLRCSPPSLKAFDMKRSS